MIRPVPLFVLALTLLFLAHCTNREQPSSPSAESTGPGARSSSPATTAPAGSTAGSSGGCVGMGCDKPVNVPGVQGCVGMGCDKEIVKP
jgi:hypothetical protein